MSGPVSSFVGLMKEAGLGPGTRRYMVQGLKDEGLVLLRDEPNHYVTFDESGWFIEHSIACRVAGTLGTCAYNAAIRMVADDMDGPDPDLLGRHRITEIDSEGLPSLERAGSGPIREGRG